MRSVAEHLAIVLATGAPLPPVRRALGEAWGLVAAEPLSSRVDLPGFDNSAMDGYAVRAVDVAGASADAPVELDVVDDLAAGDHPRLALPPGRAIRIMTGAPVPDGADTIVKVEDTDGGATRVRIRAGAPAGLHVRRRGEDLPAGRPILAAGQRLDARVIGLVAAAGHGDVLVHPRPRVAVLSTGAELVEPGKPLQHGQIHDSHSLMLAAAVTAAGAHAAYRGSVGDDPDQVREVLDRLAGEVDVIVTSGGVSMGVHDVVKAVLRDSGTVEFAQVAMQPGKPQGFGVLGPRSVPFFGLPGNPVSSYVSFEVFVRPLLRRLMGVQPAVLPRVEVELGSAVSSPAGRVQFARARVTRAGDRWVAEPVRGQGSHFVADLAASDALLEIPAEVTALAVGDRVPALLLGETPAAPDQGEPR